MFLKNIPEKKKALLAVTIASIIWGINSPVMKLALSVAPVFLFAFLRFFLAFFVLLSFRPSLRIERKDIAKVIMAALLGVTFNISFFFYGLKLSSAINAAVLISTVPIFTLLAGAFFLRERISKNMILGTVLSVFGIIAIVFGPILNSGVSQSVVGNILLLASSVSWVGFEVLSKKLFKKYSSLAITCYSFLIGSLMFLPFAVDDLLIVLPRILSDAKFIAGLFYGVFLSSACAYFFWQWGLSKLDAARVGFFLYIDPVVGTIASIVLLGEGITPLFVAGALFILLGLYQAEKRHPYSHLKANHGNIDSKAKV